MAHEEEEEAERRIYPTETAALAGGKALLKANELDDAADAFGQALELAIARHGEDSCATADYYMAYGDVLLRIVDKNGEMCKRSCPARCGDRARRGVPSAFHCQLCRAWSCKFEGRWRLPVGAGDVFGGGAQPEDPRANQENTGT